MDQLAAVAAARGVPPAQVALAWLLHRPGVTAPIIGATKLQHIDDAVAAVDVTLSPDEMKRLEEPYRPHAVSGPRRDPSGDAGGHGTGDRVDGLGVGRAEVLAEGRGRAASGPSSGSGSRAPVTATSVCEAWTSSETGNTGTTMTCGPAVWKMSFEMTHTRASESTSARR